MKAKNEADSPKTKSNLINQLGVVLRSAEVHHVKNIAVGNAINNFVSLLSEFVKYEGDFILELRGDFFFVNEFRIRYASEVMINFDYLVRLFRTLEIGTVIIKSGAGTNDIISLTEAFVKSPAVNPFETIQQKMSHVNSITVHKLKKIVEEDLLDARKMVKKSYFKAVSFTQGVMNKIQQGEKIALKKAKRMIVSLVDHIINQEQLLVSMTSIKSYDEYTYHHCVNVSILAVALGQRLGLNIKQLTELGMVSLFHDIGKLEIPSRILNKTSKLSDEEWQVIKKHPIEGVRLLLKMKHVDFISIRSAIVAFEHHMFFNNTGYPRIKKSFPLDLYSRIVSLADQYDAMTSARVYSRIPMSPDKALNLMIKQAGSQLDPLLLQFFINMVGVYPIGTLVILDSMELGLVYESNPGFVTRPRILILSDSNGNRVDAFACDLAEKKNDGDFRRTIVRTLDVSKWNINIAEYLL
ncbi:MAG: HD-GYP domain-containing protein [Desulfobacteraceae bacterium]|nr:HD-GYP domain-containing protein [Desulfobacteraceae bacterium]MBC2754471.1 HD-GYP domain-containing protein [Desulfobacteraceae bacterium]